MSNSTAQNIPKGPTDCLSKLQFLLFESDLVTGEFLFYLLEFSRPISRVSVELRPQRFKRFFCLHRQVDPDHGDLGDI
jgi:hypothetical protein